MEREDQRAEDTFRETARNLEIPAKYWNHPAVRGYINVFNALQQARAEVGELTIPVVWGGENPLESPVDFGAMLQDRYSAVESLITAAVFILNDSGKDNRKFDPRLTGGKIFPDHDPNLVLEEHEGGMITFFGHPTLEDDAGVLHVLDPQPLPNRLHDHINSALKRYGLRVVPIEDRS